MSNTWNRDTSFHQCLQKTKKTKQKTTLRLLPQDVVETFNFNCFMNKSTRKHWNLSSLFEGDRDVQWLGYVPHTVHVPDQNLHTLFDISYLQGNNS